MRYYIIAGEASGDLHGSNLMKEIRLRDPEADFRCWGGDLMKEAGGVLVKHYKDLAFMGFLEVLLHFGTILGNLRLCKADLLSFKPDVLILIDYPGFNLRVAQFAHRSGIRVVYYISPQVWAWKKKRVYQIRRDVDQMLVILPFEKEFYAGFDYEVEFVGHPLLDVIKAGPEAGLREKEKLVALLPGSRKQEIQRILPVMLSLVESFPDMEFVIAGAPGLEESFYRQWTSRTGVKLVFGQTYDLLQQASAAVVTSGTASLETALFRVPQVICYKGSPVSYAIARRLVKIKYIGLPNLIMDRPIITELIQQDLEREELKKELSSLLHDPGKRERIAGDYEALRRALGGAGASARAAGIILKHCGTES